MPLTGPPPLCPQVVKLDAGHCPHDEVPEQVNAHILRFVAQSVLPAMAKQSGGGAPAPVAATPGAAAQ